ncbi:MAG: ribonuclease P protein component [Parachlamydiales bacterium]
MAASSSAFPKEKRLLTGRDFKAVRKGKSLVGKTLILEVVPSAAGGSRLGLAVSKRYGKACKRNRFKRLCREAFRHLSLPSPLDIVVRPRHLADGVTASVVAEEMERLLKS